MTDPWDARPPQTPAPGPYGQVPVVHHDPHGPWQSSLRGELAVGAGLLAAGLLLGGVWALVAPSLAGAADPGESRIAVDGLLALLQIGAGLVTAVGLVLAPGRGPALRLVVVLVAATAGGLLSALVGAGRGLHLQAPGIMLIWPLLVALLTALRVLGALLVRPT